VIELQIGAAYRNKKDYDSAVAVYSDLLTSDPASDKARIGLALTYAILGLVAARTGALFGSLLQNPWVIGFVVTIFMTLALSMFGLYDMFTGGSLSRVTIFALGVMPYISSSIILQLLTVVWPYLERLYDALVELMRRFHADWVSGRIPKQSVMVVRYDRMMSDFSGVMDELFHFVDHEPDGEDDGEQWRASYHRPIVEPRSPIETCTDVAGVRSVRAMSREGHGAGRSGLDVADGDAICIMSRTRPEWLVADIAAWALGAVSCPIYPQTEAGQAEFIINNTGAVVVFVENAQQAARSVMARSNSASVIGPCSKLEGENEIAQKSVDPVPTRSSTISRGPAASNSRCRYTMRSWRSRRSRTSCSSPAVRSCSMGIMSRCRTASRRCCARVISKYCISSASPASMRSASSSVAMPFSVTSRGTPPVSFQA